MTETTSDGWGSRYIAPIQNTSQRWAGYLTKASAGVARGGVVIILGKRGRGKTRIAAEISRDGNFPNDLSSRDKTSCYRRATEIICELRAAMISRVGETATIRRLSAVGLLVIDEFQERGETEWENRMISTILDRRYADNLPTILIANLEIADLPNKISDSVISRANECGGVVVCDCEYFR